MNTPTHENEEMHEIPISRVKKLNQLEREKEAWVETARQYAVNEEYHRQKRFALLRWLRDLCMEDHGVADALPEEFRADFKLLDEV